MGFQSSHSDYSPPIFRQPHGAHTALPQLPDDVVAPGKQPSRTVARSCPLIVNGLLDRYGYFQSVSIFTLEHHLVVVKRFAARETQDARLGDLPFIERLHALAERRRIVRHGIRVVDARGFA